MNCSMTPVWKAERRKWGEKEALPEWAGKGEKMKKTNWNENEILTEIKALLSRTMQLQIESEQSLEIILSRQKSKETEIERLKTEVNTVKSLLKTILFFLVNTDQDNSPHPGSENE